MEEKTNRVISDMEEIALKIEKNIDDLTLNLNNIEQYIEDYKGDKKIINEELKGNDIMKRVQIKIDKLTRRMF